MQFLTNLFKTDPDAEKKRQEAARKSQEEAIRKMVLKDFNKLKKQQQKSSLTSLPSSASTIYTEAPIVVTTNQAQNSQDQLAEKLKEEMLARRERALQMEALQKETANIYEKLEKSKENTERLRAQHQKAGSRKKRKSRGRKSRLPKRKKRSTSRSRRRYHSHRY